MTKLYQQVTGEDVRQDEESIIEVLSSIMDGRLTADIKLLNFYKELPVSYDASVEFIDRGVVEMKVHEMQAASMMLQKETFIKSIHLPHDVVAKVVRVKKEKNLAFVAGFSYVQIPAERRQYVRVKVSEKVDASFFDSQHLVSGAIEEISFGGVLIDTPKGTALRKNVKGVVSLLLPDVRLEVPGKLLKVHEADSSDKCVFELEPDMGSERQISRFILRQQSKILRELKDICSIGVHG